MDRKVLTGPCYNRRRIKELESQASNAEKRRHFHRYSQGEKVKSFAPVSQCHQNGGGQTNGVTKKASNPGSEDSGFSGWRY
jgi:hypothetical protein